MTPVGYLVKRIGQDHSELRFKPPADLPFNRKNWTWKPVFLSPIPSPDSMDGPSPADDVAGLVADMLSRADAIDHAGNKDPGPWSDDLRVWAAALSRLQARLAEVEAELTTTEQLRHEENRRACSETEKRWAAEASAATMRQTLRLHVAYEAIPADRGGKNGPKGRAWAAFIAARDAALGGQHGK
jgi:hypothetical protein